jgi:hypothetical protein
MLTALLRFLPHQFLVVTAVFAVVLFGMFVLIKLGHAFLALVRDYDDTRRRR